MRIRNLDIPVMRPPVYVPQCPQEHIHDCVSTGAALRLTTGRLELIDVSGYLLRERRLGLAVDLSFFR